MRKFFGRSLISVVIVLFSLGAAVIACPLGDLDGNCKVGLGDLQVFAQQWLDDDGCSGPNCANLDGVGDVTMSDFARLGQQWGKDLSGLVISEFMAVNDETLPDEEGKFRDWLEIYNPTGEAINLDGWYLTDNDANLTKWRFPSVEVDPGEFLVVFASGKDREDPNELHTNFKLDGDGEYLALVAADGKMVVHEYAPAYPEQLTDISYGLSQHAITVVPTGATASYHVPAAGDADADWAALDFEDAQWDTGPTALGFASDPVETGEDIGDPSAPGSYSLEDGVYTVIGDGRDIWDTADSFYFVYTPLTGDCELSAHVVSMTNTHAWAKAGVMIRETLDPGSKRAMEVLTFSSGAAFQRRIVANEISLHTSGGGIAAPYWVRIVRSGDTFTGYHSPDGVNWTLHGSENITMAQQVYVGLCVTSHQDGVLGTSVFDSLAGGNEVSSDLAEQMLGVNSSLWMRIEFDLEEGQADLFDTLTLQMKYEDGFIAYLNSRKIAERNAPAWPLWNSTALTDRPIEDSSAFESINVNSYMSELRTGRNVLAVHALNDEAFDPNFTILPELTAASNISIPQYFTTATPSAFNVPGAEGIVAEVSFSHKRGFYDLPFVLTLSTEMTDDDVEIRYTTDGSQPTITHGDIYNPSLPLNISRTSTIRAIAVKPGWLDSRVETQTYIFVDDVIRQNYQATLDSGFPSSWGGTSPDYGMDPDVTENPIYSATIEDDLKSIPTVSIVMNVDDMFGSSGIYTNSSSRGLTWERPTSVELIHPDGSEGFQIDCGIRIHGGWFRLHRATKKHNLRLLFKAQYGPTKLLYPWFGDDAVDYFDTVVLRAGANDGYSWDLAYLTEQYTRDEFGRRLQKAAGHASPLGTFVHLYINGIYWGLYNPIERADAAFSATYYGGEKEDWDAIHDLSASNGNKDAWNQMVAKCSQAQTSYAAYQELQGNDPDGTPNPDYPHLLDVMNYIDYLIVNVSLGNDDWPFQNWWAGRHNAPESTGFKFYCWDIENIMGNNREWSPLDDDTLNNDFSAAGLPHRSLKHNAEYRMLFGDRVHRFLFNGGILTPQSLIPRYTELAAEVERAIVPESARWGDQHHHPPLTLQEWYDERGWILDTYLVLRSDIVIQQYVDAGLYPPISAPVFSRHGGWSDTGFDITMTGGSTIWYTADGNDPRLPGGETNPDAIAFGRTSIHIGASTYLKARVKSGDTWSALNEAVFGVHPLTYYLRITEIMYHPQATSNPDDPNEEFIELTNIGGTPINLNLVSFTNGIDFTFGDIELAAGEYVVVVRNAAAFAAQHPGFSGVIAGEYTGSLDNAGERIELADATGQIIHNFRYRDGWRPITDGEGFSLTIIDPFNPDPNSWDEKDSWRASAYVGGSPGSDDSGILPNPGAIAINEVLAHSHAEAADWIELYNTTDAEIEIGAWYLSDSRSDLKKYRIADGEKIGAYDYLVLREDVNFGELSPPTADPGRVTGFALSENGDEVYLSSAEGGILMGYREAEDFGASPTGVSFGRYFKTSTGNYNFVLMDHETPGWANAYPKVGPIVISEIMYNPISGDQRQEYIELHNFGSTAVTLYDSNESEPWKFTDGVDYTFPDYPGLTISAGGYVLIVKDVPAYINEYGVPPSGVMLLGSYGGRLSNAGEKLELSRPGDVDVYGERYYIRVDRVNYSDGSHPGDAPEDVDLWPTEPDGGGGSLSRDVMSNYGNDPNNWIAASPSPGGP